MDKEQIKALLLDDIKVNTIRYPFISKFWDIDISKQEQIKEENIEFGHFGTNTTHSDPFYKPISKIIDLSQLV